MGVWVISVFSPGPDILLILRQSLLRSRGHAYAAALGVSLGVAIWLGIALSGLHVLSGNGMRVVQFAGGVFLLWLAWGTLREGDDPQAQVTATPQGLRASFAVGLVTNLTNPKFLVFLLSFFSALVPAAASAAERGLVWVLMVATSAVQFCLIAAMAGLPGLRQRLMRRGLVVRAITAALFALLGIFAILAALPVR